MAGEEWLILVPENWNRHVQWAWRFGPCELGAGPRGLPPQAPRSTKWTPCVTDVGRRRYRRFSLSVLVCRSTERHVHRVKGCTDCSQPVIAPVRVFVVFLSPKIDFHHFTHYWMATRTPHRRILAITDFPFASKNGVYIANTMSKYLQPRTTV